MSGVIPSCVYVPAICLQRSGWVIPVWEGSGRQWRQRATRLQPTCDYCGDGAQRVRTQCKQHTEPQTTFGGWNTSVRSGWPETDTEWLMSDQGRGDRWTWWGCLKPDLSASFWLALSLAWSWEAFYIPCLTIHPMACQTDQTAATSSRCSGARAHS